jgi:succinoglycan biosynthesis transport protein ExoP
MSSFDQPENDPLNEQPLDISKLSGAGSASFASPPPEQRWESATPKAPRVEWKSGAIDYLRLVTKYRVWVVCGLIIGLLVGHLIYQTLGPEFTATAKVLVSKRAAAPTRLEGEAHTWGDRAEHISLIMSPLIVTRAIELHKLDELPTLRGSTDPVEDIIDDLKGTRSAGLDQSVLNILDVTFKSKSREDAKAVVNAIVDAYDSFLKSQHTENTNELIELVGKTSAKIQQDIDEVETDYGQFRDTAPIHVRRAERGVNGERITMSANIHDGTLTSLQTKRVQLGLQRDEVESQILAIESALAAGQPRDELAATIQLFSSPVSAGSNPSQTTVAINDPNTIQASLDAQLLPLMLRERELVQQFGPDWPDVVIVRSQMATLYQYYQQRGLPVPGQPGNAPGAAAQNPLTQVRTASGKDLIDLYLLSLTQKLASISDQEVRIDVEYKIVSNKARSLGTFLEQDRKFNDRIDRLNGLWNLMETQASKLDIEKETPGYNLKQIAPARDELSLKRIAKLYGAGVIGVCGLLAAIIFWVEWRDTTLKSVEEIRNSLSLPVLGTVPDFETSSRGITGPLQAALCYYHNPGSPEAEAYRSVRTAFNVCVSSSQKLIQVTSPELGDGKSTLIANLAIAIAQSGRKVLLIDGDLRKPTLHKLFGLRQSIGVTDVANGEIDLLTAAQPTVVEGLSVLTSGDIPNRPAELLASHEFSQLLSAAEQEYDSVLIDTPPLLAVSDPCIVAPRTNGMILVLRLQKNSRAAARRATELIETNHINVIGIVANGSEEAPDGYEYRQSYGDYLNGVASSRDATPRRSEQESTSVGV